MKTEMIVAMFMVLAAPSATAVYVGGVCIGHGSDECEDHLLCTGDAAGEGWCILHSRCNSINTVDPKCAYDLLS